MSIAALANGNIAVITGGASGIGLAAARRLAAIGLEVCIVDRDHAALDVVVDSIDGVVRGYVADVSDRAAIETLAHRIADEAGPVSVLMNNAGVGGGGDALSNPDGWARLLGVNLFGVLNGVQAFVPAMVAGDKPGLVINTGSKQGITQPPGRREPDAAGAASNDGDIAIGEGCDAHATAPWVVAARQASSDVTLSIP